VITLFRDKSLITIFVLALLTVLAHLHIFFHPMMVNNICDNGYISLFIQNYLVSVSPTVLSILFIFIIFLQALLLNAVLDEWKMFQKSSSTIAATYILITACFPEFNCISAGLINIFLVILFISLFERMYNNNKPNSLLFNIGFTISTSAFLFKPDVIFMFISFLALAIIRPFRLKEWLILLIGIFVPVYLLGSILFLNDKFDFIRNSIPYFQMHRIVLTLSVWFWIKSSVIILALLMGINQWLPNYYRMIISIRRNWIILFLSMLILAGLPFVLYKGGFLDLLILLPLIACFISSLFLYPKRLLLPNFIFILLLILITHTNLLMTGLIKK